MGVVKGSFARLGAVMAVFVFLMTGCSGGSASSPQTPVAPVAPAAKATLSGNVTFPGDVGTGKATYKTVGLVGETVAVDVFTFDNIKQNAAPIVATYDAKTGSYSYTAADLTPGVDYVIRAVKVKADKSTVTCKKFVEKTSVAVGTNAGLSVDLSTTAAVTVVEKKLFETTGSVLIGKSFKLGDESSTLPTGVKLADVQANFSTVVGSVKDFEDKLKSLTLTKVDGSTSIDTTQIANAATTELKALMADLATLLNQVTLAVKASIDTHDLIVEKKDAVVAAASTAITTTMTQYDTSGNSTPVAVSQIKNMTTGSIATYTPPAEVAVVAGDLQKALASGLYSGFEHQYLGNNVYSYSYKIIKQTSDPTKLTETRYFYDSTSKTWTTTVPANSSSDSASYFLTSTGWVKSADTASNGTIAFAADGTVTFTHSADSSRMVISTEIFDLSNTLMLSYLAEGSYGYDGSIYKMWLKDSTLKFPAGAKGIRLKFKQLDDSYKIWAGTYTDPQTGQTQESNRVGVYDSVTRGMTYLTTLEQIPTTLKAGSSNRFFLNSNSGSSIYAVFTDSSNVAVYVQQYVPGMGMTGEPVQVGTGTYAVKTVLGQSIGVVTLSDDLRLKYRVGADPILVVKDGYVRVGTYSKAGTSGDNDGFNTSLDKAAFDALVANSNYTVTIVPVSPTGSTGSTGGTAAFKRTISKVILGF
jgi:hypothetical protein